MKSMKNPKNVKTMKTVLTFSGCALICAASLLMPDAVLRARDSALRGRTETVPVEEVELSLGMDLTDIGKLRLAGDYSAVSIPMDSGLAMTGEQAMDSALGWVDAVIGDGVTKLVRDARAELRVSGDGASAIVWLVDVTGGDGDSEWNASLTVDDATGMLLSFSCAIAGAPDAEGPYTSYEYEGKVPSASAVTGQPGDTAEDTDGYAVYDGGTGDAPGDPWTDSGGLFAGAPEDAQVVVLPADAYVKAARVILDGAGLEYTLYSNDDGTLTARVVQDGESVTVPIICYGDVDGSVVYFSVNS